MNDIIDKLKSPPPPVMVPGCSTCRHLWGKHIVTPGYLRCLAFGGNDAREVYIKLCNGDRWEPKPSPVPVFTRLKRWLVG